jgi:glutamate-1-semialdehyde 2,1-aminomutase
MTNLRQEIISRFIERTPKSQAMTERAKKVLPGGDTRTGVYYAPYPAYMVGGQGTTLNDLDGNNYLDFLNNYTSLVHGHAHPAILEAVQGALNYGAVYASPMMPQIELAEIICARVPSVERLRFTNSGTEGTMLAIRAARAYTGRGGIIKMMGAYHGSHDISAATADPDADRGIADGLRQDLYFAPYNDLPAIEAILNEHASKIAAIIVEPVPNAGGIPLPKAGYLQGLRNLADKHGVSLIFDEVVTLRLNEGGYQAVAGVTPDLTAMGKIIGGGFAVGAFGGRREVMDVFDPNRQGSIGHSGTFNGHSQTMRAGIASLGQQLAKGFDDAFAEAGIVGQTTSVGSLVQVHWQLGAIANMSDVERGFKAAGDLPYLLHLELMNRGLYAAARGEYNTSTVMTQADVERAVMLFNEVLHYLKPHVAEVYPELLRG